MNMLDIRSNLSGFRLRTPRRMEGNLGPGGFGRTGTALVDLNIFEHHFQLGSFCFF